MHGLSFTRLERLCMLLALCLVGCLCVPGVKLLSQMGRPDYSGVPQLTYEQLEPKLRQLRAELDAPVGDSPRDYFIAAKKASDLEPVIMRFHHQGVESRQRLGQYGFAWGTLDSTIELQGRYTKRFGQVAMAEAADSYADPDAVNRMMGKTLPVDWKGVFDTFLSWYTISFFIAAAFFAARVRSKGMLLRYELAFIAFYAMGWPVKVWQYPTRVNPIEQLQRLRRWAAMMIASSLSFAPLAMAKAAERKANGEQTAGDGTVLVVSEIPKPRVFVEGGVMSAKRTGNGFVVNDGPTSYASVSADLGDGFTLGYWGSRELEGTGGSDEHDITLTWSGSRGESLGLAYYDIVPLGKTKGGDMISPYAEIGRPVAGRVTAVLRGEAYFLTHGAGNNGFLLSAALKGSRDFRNASVGQSIALVYAKGPFRQEEGAVFRSDTTLTVPLTKRAKALLTLKAFVPLAGAHDRKAGASVIAGAAYAF